MDEENTVGKKIRAYRQERGLSQVQLSKLSGINVGTIRKYELGIRNPKPAQLQKIAGALAVNVSVFLDFGVETVSDVLCLLYAIDDAVDLTLSENKETGDITLKFKHPTMQKALKDWCKFKEAVEKDTNRALEAFSDNPEKLEIAFNHLKNLDEQWKLRSTGTATGCAEVVTKGTNNRTIKIYSNFKTDF